MNYQKAKTRVNRHFKYCCSVLKFHHKPEEILGRHGKIKCATSKELGDILNRYGDSNEPQAENLRLKMCSNRLKLGKVGQMANIERHNLIKFAHFAVQHVNRGTFGQNLSVDKSELSEYLAMSMPRR